MNHSDGGDRDRRRSADRSAVRLCTFFRQYSTNQNDAECNNDVTARILVVSTSPCSCKSKRQEQETQQYSGTGNSRGHRAVLMSGFPVNGPYHLSIWGSLSTTATTSHAIKHMTRNKTDINICVWNLLSNSLLNYEKKIARDKVPVRQ